MRQPVETQLRNYFEQIEETHGPLSTNAILDRSATVQVIPESRPLTPPSRAIRKWAWAIALIVFVGVAIVLGTIVSETPPVDQPVTTTVPGTLPAANGWIAFSTQHGMIQTPGVDGEGGDIYLVREGIDPKIIVSRGDANTTNVCPMFSPDGSMLVYGERTDSPSSALVVLAVTIDGTVDEVARIEVPVSAGAPCAAWWSPDGVRIGYVLGSKESYLVPDHPQLVIRGLDGSTPEAGPADPTIDELMSYKLGEEGPLLSPDGQLIVDRGTDGQVAVSNADGTDRRVIPPSLNPFYSVPGWSPDGRYVLTMEDVGGRIRYFELAAHTVDEPYESVVLAPMIRTNGPTSWWPGRGDVSWQPIYPGP